MIGSGDADACCFLCGLPFSKPPDHLMEGVDLEWLESGVGFDQTRNLTTAVDGYDDYGRFPIWGSRRPHIPHFYKTAVSRFCPFFQPRIVVHLFGK